MESLVCLCLYLPFVCHLHSFLFLCSSSSPLPSSSPLAFLVNVLFCFAPAQKMAKTVKRTISKRKQQKKTKKVKPLTKFVIDCEAPAADEIVDTGSIADYLKQRIKVEGKAGNLGKKIVVANTDSKVSVETSGLISKRYIKYLAKRFLKKQGVREYVRIASADKASYALRYFRMSDNVDEE